MNCVDTTQIWNWLLEFYSEKGGWKSYLHSLEWWFCPQTNSIIPILSSIQKKEKYPPRRSHDCCMPADGRRSAATRSHNRCRAVRHYWSAVEPKPRSSYSHSSPSHKIPLCLTVAAIPSLLQVSNLHCHYKRKMTFTPR